MRWTPSLIAIILLSACATTGRPVPAGFTVEVESRNWSAAAVRIMCAHRQIGVVRDVALNRTTRGTVALGACAEISIVVESIGGFRYDHPHVVHVEPGDLVRFTIAPVLEHSSLWPDDHRRGDRTGWRNRGP